MKCKWDSCNREARARSPFCSGTCKKRYQRLSGTNVTVDVSGTVEACITSDGPTVSLEHYQANPDMYATRMDAERLNWGKRMNMNELNIAGKKANRVPIPGDWDYEGAVV